MRAYISEQCPDAESLNPARDTLERTLDVFNLPVVSSYAMKLRRIRESRPETPRTWTVVHTIPASNRHVPDETIAADKLLSRFHKRDAA